MIQINTYPHLSSWSKKEFDHILLLPSLRSESDSTDTFEKENNSFPWPATTNFDEGPVF